MIFNGKFWSSSNQVGHIGIIEFTDRLAYIFFVNLPGEGSQHPENGITTVGTDMIPNKHHVFFLWSGKQQTIKHLRHVHALHSVGL